MVFRRRKCTLAVVFRSGGAPAKRVHASPEDYDALHLPWNYIAKVLRGLLGMNHATYRDETGTRRGYQPSHTTPPDVYAEMRLLWKGKLHVQVAYPDQADPPGSWCLILCEADEVGACDAPLLPCPAKEEPFDRRIYNAGLKSEVT